jgi:hypothetical protein
VEVMMMGLSTELISEFVKITNDNKKSKEDNTVYGTVKTVSADGKSGTVEIDGSNEATPVSTTCTISAGDRVRLNIRNHNAIVTGNVSDQSIGVKRAGAMESLVEQTADSIRSEVSNKVDNLTSSLDITAEGIRSEVSASLAKVNANIGGLDTRVTNAESRIDQTASKITATVAAEFTSVNNQLQDIGTEIQGLSGRITNAESSISQTATEITTEVRAYYDTVNGKVDNFSTFKQTVEGFSFMGKGGNVKISGGDINLTGAIKFSDLNTTTQTRIAGAEGAANTAAENAENALRKVESAQSAAEDAQDAADAVDATLAALLDEDDVTTYIDGKKIVTESLYVDKIKLGEWMTVYKKLSVGTTTANTGGYFGYNEGFNSDRGIGMWSRSGEGQCICTNEAARLSYGSRPQVVASKDGNITLDASGAVYLERNGTVVASTYNDGANNMFIPGGNGKIYLGRSSNYWIAVYANNYYGGTANATGSDRNIKNSIEDLPDKYVKMFDQLRPVRYKLNNGTSDRYHIGYIAQEVEEAMTEADIDSQEFGGLVKDKNEDGTYTYMLRYDEFDAIRDAKIKQLEARNAELEARIEKLEKLLTQNT